MISDETLEVLQNRIYAIDSLRSMTENLDLLELSQIQDWWEYWNQRHIGKAKVVSAKLTSSIAKRAEWS